MEYHLLQYISLANSSRSQQQQVALVYLHMLRYLDILRDIKSVDLGVLDRWRVGSYRLVVTRELVYREERK